jgi:outer membrane receptor protein involved in Fe transport
MKSYVRWSFCLVFGVFGGLLATVQAQEAVRYELPELVIDAERSSMQQSLPFSHESIGSETLNLRFAPTPNDSLKLNSSVSLPASMKGMGGAPSIRGFPNYSNQVLLDGTPITMPWANWANVTTFPLRRLRNVEVVKGGSSLLYGAGGLAGAINLTLPQARDLEGLTLLEEAGGQGWHHREALYGGIAHQNQHLFGYFHDESRGYQKHAERENGTVLYRGAVETDSQWRLRLGLLESQGRAQLPDLGDPTMTPQENDRWNISHRDFVAEKDFGNGRHLTLRLYQNTEYSHSIDYTNHLYTTRSGSGVMDMTTQGREVLYNITLGVNRLGVGWQSRTDKMTGSSVGNVDRRLETNGWLLSDLIDVSSRLKLHLIGRSDHHSTAGKAESWSAHADYRVNSRSSVNIGQSRLVRFPVMRELYMTFTGSKNASGTWSASIPGQGDLQNRPEKARTTEFAYVYRPRADWEISVGRFVSQVSGLINQVSNPAWPKASPRFWWRNLANVDITGWESRIQGTVQRGLRLWLGYTRLDSADDTGTGVRLNERPNYKLTGGLTLTRGRTTSLLNWERRGEALYLMTGQGKSQDAALPAATRFDLTIRRELTSLTSAYISIDNLGDADIESLGHVIGALPIYETPRRVLLGLECRFK